MNWKLEFYWVSNNLSFSEALSKPWCLITRNLWNFHLLLLRRGLSTPFCEPGQCHQSPSSSYFCHSCRGQIQICISFILTSYVVNIPSPDQDRNDLISVNCVSFKIDSHLSVEELFLLLLLPSSIRWYHRFRFLSSCHQVYFSNTHREMILPVVLYDWGIWSFR